MAVTNVKQASTLGIKVQKGTNAAGSPVYAVRKYPIKADSADADNFAVATAIADLQQYPMALIERIDTGNLISA